MAGGCLLRCAHLGSHLDSCGKAGTAKLQAGKRGGGLRAAAAAQGGLSCCPLQLAGCPSIQAQRALLQARVWHMARRTLACASFRRMACRGGSAERPGQARGARFRGAPLLAWHRGVEMQSQQARLPVWTALIAGNPTQPSLECLPGRFSRASRPRALRPTRCGLPAGPCRRRSTADRQACCPGSCT